MVTAYLPLMGTPPRSTVRHATGTLLAALALTGALTGCSPSVPPPAASPRSPATSTSSPAQICTSLVSYWAKETLMGTTWSGLDWEQKGLSNDQYAIHEDAVAAGRIEERTAGRDKALELIDRFVSQRCATQDGATGSSGNRRPRT